MRQEVEETSSLWLSTVLPPASGPCAFHTGTGDLSTREQSRSTLILFGLHRGTHVHLPIRPGLKRDPRPLERQTILHTSSSTTRL